MHSQNKAVIIQFMRTLLQTEFSIIIIK